VLALATVCTLAPLAQAASPVGGGEAAEPGHAGGASSSSSSAAGEAATAEAARAKAEARLEAAREKLEEAAREVAELSGSAANFVYSTEITGSSRSIIGAVLDASDSQNGLRVVSVSPGGPAAEAGLRPGDVVTTINGVDVRGRNTARAGLRTLRQLAPDSKVTLKLLRDGKPLEITATTRAAPHGFAFGQVIPPIPPVPPMPPMPAIPPVHFSLMQQRGPLGDLELATLTPQLGHYFGTEKGVLVLRVPEHGALELKDGDVILTIDGRDATSASHVTRILGSYQSGEKLTLHIVRDRRPLTLEETVPASQPGNGHYRWYLSPQGEGESREEREHGGSGTGGPVPESRSHGAPPPPHEL
jgi:S1-C subfamily serine protease